MVCHGVETAEADLRLDQMALNEWNDANLLDDIYTALELGEMPPEDAPTHPEARQRIAQ